MKVFRSAVGLGLTISCTKSLIPNGAIIFGSLFFKATTTQVGVSTHSESSSVEVTPHTPNHTPNQLSGSLCRRDRRTESSMARLSAVLFVREPKEIFLLSTR